MFYLEFNEVFALSFSVWYVAREASLRPSLSSIPDIVRMRAYQGRERNKGDLGSQLLRSKYEIPDKFTACEPNVVL